MGVSKGAEERSSILSLGALLLLSPGSGEETDANINDIYSEGILYFVQFVEFNDKFAKLKFVQTHFLVK